MNPFQTNAPTYSQTTTRDQVRQQASTVFLAKVFNWMAMGLGLTALVAYLTASTGLGLALIQSGILMVLCLVELGLVWFLAARVNKIKAATATGLFIGYAFLNGLTLSYIFLQYTGATIFSTFLVAAGMFGAMAVYGLVTKRDLTSMGSFLLMGLFGLILAMLVNVFLHSNALGFAISIVGVIVFVGLTAYDTQKIKEMGEQGIMTQGGEMVQKGAIMGALALYLDFINLFLFLLRLFGGGDD